MNLFLHPNNSQRTNYFWIGPSDVFFFFLYRAMHENDNQSFPRILTTYLFK